MHIIHCETRAVTHRTLHRIGPVIATCAAALVAATVLVGCGADGDPAPRVLHVPADHDTIASAVADARPGDIVQIAAGTYHESVKVTVDHITIRGDDRNAVVLDGGDNLSNGFMVGADDVAIENLTVHHFTQNGIVFNGIEAVSGDKGAEAGVEYGAGNAVLKGYRVSYVTAYDNGLYGIYAFSSRDGLVEHSYVSGHPDSGIYIGQCKPCNAVVRDVVAETNAIGYYGTNASGGVYVIESTFRGNRLGIAPNSQRAEHLTPQVETYVVGNVVADNDNPDAPVIPNNFFGVGIAIGGGTKNVVARNLVTGNAGAGIMVLQLNEFAPLDNRIDGNTATGNGSDLVYAPDDRTTAGGNCFTGNTFDTSVPDDIETAMACDGSGTLGAVPKLTLPTAPAGPDYRTLPAPPPQPTMPAGAMSAVAGAGVVPVIDIASIALPRA